MVNSILDVWAAYWIMLWYAPYFMIGNKDIAESICKK